MAARLFTELFSDGALCGLMKPYQTRSSKISTAKPRGEPSGSRCSTFSAQSVFAVGIPSDTQAVLVPRPETEELIELAFEAAKTMPCPVIYDFGTGSGCIAVTLAKRLTKAKVIASDISDEAIRLAKANAESMR